MPLNKYLSLSIIALCALASLGAVGSGEEIVYHSAERRDPMMALIGPGGVTLLKPTTEGLNIEGIIHDPRGGSMVLVNGEFFREGETVQNATIISIMKNHVIVMQESEEMTLWLRDEIVEAES